MRRNRLRFTGKINLSGRDEQTNVEVSAVLAELPAAHPARTGFAEGKDTIALTQLLADRMDLVKRLVETVFAHDKRIYDKRSQSGAAIRAC